MRKSIGLAALLIFGAASLAPAQTLSVGDPAPPITVSKWVKGDKIDELKADGTYVVEFWATWCGPCRTSIPHLTELQEKYKDQGVKIIGVSVWEQDQSGVVPFVEEMGDKMDYNVAMDQVPDGASGNEGKMAGSWMTASGSNGIPTAFIVKARKIYWIGHPMSMEEPLAKVVSGDFDLAQAVASYKQEKAAEQQIMQLQQEFQEALRGGKMEDAIAVLDKAMVESPMLEAQLGVVKLNLLQQVGRQEEMIAYGNKLVAGAFKDNADALNNLGWMLANGDDVSKPTAQLAVKAAARANEISGGDDANILDTLALATFKAGDARKAVELQEKAMKLAGDENPEMCARLEEFRAAAKKANP